jgi:two-component system nitrogen regulation sensor histidine kinase GlnL
VSVYFVQNSLMEDPHQILDALATAVVVLDGALRIETLNSAAESLLHVSQVHAQGMPLQELIMRAEKLVPSLRHALEDGQPFTQRDTTLRLPDNVIEDVDVTASILEQPSGGARSLVLEFHPLNRLKRINKDGASVARQETARQLIRGLAHEVKNPLGGIRGAAQLLERELPSEELKEYTGVIITEADRLKELVDRMLGPQRELNLTQVNILQVFEHVIQLIEAERPNTIKWIRDYDPSVPDFEADEAQIIQSILNVLRNACQALQDSDEPQIQLRSRVVRQFTIGAARHRMVMRLDITDNGPGIDPELEERIFFPMISGRADGTGLGLAITQNIVAQHHGSIQVSTRPGHTCFSIYLPFTHAPRDQINEEVAQA